MTSTPRSHAQSLHSRWRAQLLRDADDSTKEASVGQAQTEALTLT